jgi:hypothetical protein
MSSQNLSSESSLNWSSVQKIAFRFCFIFFILNTFPFPISELRVVGDFIKTPYEDIWTKVINIVGKLFLGLSDITVRPNGSGDTTWNWVQVFSTLVFSVIGCVIWSILDKKRPNYQALSFWNTLYLRYYLAIAMLTYGIFKIVPAQFGEITGYNLSQQVGDMSPMRLLWIFMAYSTKYQFFAGFMECLAGVLLLFRRTTLLGALLSIGVMVNVFAMNMCFDVPVKLFSFSLVLIGIYLIAPDISRLFNFFILQNPTEAPPQYQPAFLKKKGYKIGRLVLKTLVILGFVVPLVMQILEIQEETKAAPLSDFYGRYVVAKHLKNNVEVTLIDTLRWEKLFIDRQDSSNVMYATNEMGLRTKILFEKDDSTKTIMGSDSTKYQFTYQHPDSIHLNLRGIIGTDSVHIELLKRKKKEFLLVKRGFHWINEYPFNR